MGIFSQLSPQVTGLCTVKSTCLFQCDSQIEICSLLIMGMDNCDTVTVICTPVCLKCGNCNIVALGSFVCEGQLTTANMSSESTIESVQGMTNLSESLKQDDSSLVVHISLGCIISILLLIVIVLIVLKLNRRVNQQAETEMFEL